MSGKEMIITFLGAMMYSFVINRFFNEFIKDNVIYNGYFTSFSLIGLFWLLNHGIDSHMIVQSGPIWIDMALAAGIGVMIKSILQLKKNYSSRKILQLINWSLLLQALLGGTLAGIILHLMR